MYMYVARLLEIPRARAHLYDTGEPAGVADVLEADGPAGDALALVRVERVDEPDVGSLPLRARRRRRLAVAQTLLQHSETTTKTQDASTAASEDTGCQSNRSSFVNLIIINIKRY